MTVQTIHTHQAECPACKWPVYVDEDGGVCPPQPGPVSTPRRCPRGCLGTVFVYADCHEDKTERSVREVSGLR